MTQHCLILGAQDGVDNLDQKGAPPVVVLQPQIIEVLQDLLGRRVALDEAVLVEEHHVACSQSMSLPRIQAHITPENRGI